MPAPSTIYFPQVATAVWADWIEVVNVGTEEAHVTALARDQNGNAVWSASKRIVSFQCWLVPAEGQADKKGVEVSLEVSADQPILGERHCHHQSQVLDFPGAAVELDSAGTKLFFPEIASYIEDWIRFFNVGEADAIINLIGRDRSTGKVIQQLSGQAKPKGFWTVDDRQMGKLTGTLEVVSSQPIIGERHSHYQGGKTAIGQLAQVTEGREPAPSTIYFPQIAAGGWGDWVIVTNVNSHAQANLNALARDINGHMVWSGTKTLEPYQCWIVPVDGVADKKGDVSLEVSSDHGVLGERHCHNGSQILSFAGASPNLGSVGTRLFFPEIYSGAHDFFRFFNTGEADALITVVARDRNSARVVHQIQGRATPKGFWTVPDKSIKSATGTLEVISTQPVAGERHMHYQGGKTAISQLGQVIAL